jgi:hypothetical protein
MMVVMAVFIVYQTTSKVHAVPGSTQRTQSAACFEVCYK